MLMYQRVVKIRALVLVACLLYLQGTTGFMGSLVGGSITWRLHPQVRGCLSTLLSVCVCPSSTLGAAYISQGTLSGAV